MRADSLYIDGVWSTPRAGGVRDLVDPATEAVYGTLSLGGAADIDRAVTAARRAFAAYARTSREARIQLLTAIDRALQQRHDALAAAITQEMGAPAEFSHSDQVGAVFAPLGEMIALLSRDDAGESFGTNAVIYEPIGVCGLITPWNWPLSQIALKVFPALAAGCTMVLKPSEIAPLSATLFAEAMEEAGVPPGVFNLVQGIGSEAGAALAAHPDVDMVSFTGSTRGGIAVSKAAADTVKRVTLELGGKSPNIVLEDADIAAAVHQGVLACMGNSGQSCNAPTRMFVPQNRQEEAIAVAREAAESIVVGDPNAPGTMMGPVSGLAQFEKVQALIEAGMREGAKLVCGGAGRPAGLNAGYFVRPTVFAAVDNTMRIAREEIFGPVLCIIPYTDEADAVRMANDTPYGLAAYVQSGDLAHARAVARELRAGNVHINGASEDSTTPFGGYKQSGNGREGGLFGLREFQEVKAVLGWGEE